MGINWNDEKFKEQQRIEAEAYEERQRLAKIALLKKELKELTKRNKV